MKNIAPDIWTWSVFSEEKKLDFNGLYLKVPGNPLLIDPPPLSEEDIVFLASVGLPKQILLTNKDHRRASVECCTRLGSQIFIHLLDQPLLDVPADGTFLNGETVGGCLEAVHLPDQKSPGETAFYWRSKRILILGDALIGKPAGRLSLLPPEKYANPNRAAQTLERLRPLDIEMILVGDGQSILHGGAAALESFFAEKSMTSKGG